MSGTAAQRRHVTTDDGVELVATVSGEGPPVLMLPAGPGDSTTCWQFVQPELDRHVTCHLLDTRGRGASGDHPDHRPERLVADVLAYAGTVGGPVGVVGWGSGLWARVAAAAPASVAAVVAYEPAANEVMGDEVAETFAGALPAVGELVEQGRAREAAETFLGSSGAIYTDEELASGAPSTFWRASAGGLGVFLRDEEAEASTAPGPTDPAVLSAISSPVLLLRGTRSRPWFRDSVTHVAEHLPEVAVEDVEGAAHFGPHLHAPDVAERMAAFFAAHLRTR